MLLLQQLNYTGKTLSVGYWSTIRDFTKCNQMLKTSKSHTTKAWATRNRTPLASCGSLSTILHLSKTWEEEGVRHIDSVRDSMPITGVRQA